MKGKTTESEMEAEGTDMLKSLLPSKFQYRVHEFKILEESEIFEEQRFHASFEVNISRKEDAEEFLKSLCSGSSAAALHTFLRSSNANHSSRLRPGKIVSG